MTSVTIAPVVTSSIQYQLTMKGFICPTKLAADTDVPVLDAPSTKLPSVSSSQTITNAFSNLLDFSASQLESQCSLLEQQIRLCEQFHSIKANFSICEAHNLRLDDELTSLTTAHSVLESDLSRLRADHLAFCQRATEATAQFPISYQAHFKDCSQSDSYWYLPLQQTRDTAYTLACRDWRTAFGDLLPPPRPPYLGEWDPYPP